MKEFQLDPRLANDCIDLGDLRLCRVLLMNESRYPWCILVPRRPDISEVFQLETSEQEILWREATLLAEEMQTTFQADKMNVAALGNVVAQLHVHVIARSRKDRAWPATVWGKFEPEAYATPARDEMRARLNDLLERVRTRLQAPAPDRSGLSP